MNSRSRKSNSQNSYNLKESLTKSDSKGKKKLFGKIDKAKAKKIAKKAGIIGSITVLVLSLLSIVGLLVLVQAYSSDLPDLDKYFEEERQEGKESIIVDRNGKELYRIRGEEIKERLNIEDTPEKLKWAFLAAEDAQFYEHDGLNMAGLTRAIVCHATDFNNNKGCGGGSSITQQVIKNVVDDSSRTLERKVREAVMAMKIEDEMSKDEILEFYINVVPEGGILVGAKSGSKYLFGKDDVNDLTLAEMAYLAAIPNQPAVLSPWGGTLYDPERSDNRAIYVLERMRDIKDKSGVTDEEVDEAISQIEEGEITFAKSVVDKKAPHYVDYVLQELNEIYSEHETDESPGYKYLEDKGYTIRVAVDLETQQMIEDHLAETVPSQNFQSVVNAHNAAAVMMDPRNGEVRALVGSRNYFEESDDQKFNPLFNAALSPRSMGSTMKPPLYLTAFMNGYHQNTKLIDMPGIDLRADEYGSPYYPQNYNRNFGEFGGNLPTIQTSLQYSLNVPAVTAYNMVGRDSYVDTYLKLNSWEGMKEQVQGPSAPLGSANMPLIQQVQAYNTMASMGVYRPMKTILEIKDDNDEIIEDFTNNEGTQVIDKKYIHMINELNKNYSLFTYDDLLLDMKNSMDVAGKTGTSDNSAGQPGDASFIMYTPTMTLGVWAGNSCGADQCPLQGSNSTGEGMYQNLYKGFLQKYRSKIEPARFESDVPGLTTVEICPESGHKHSELCPSGPITITVADSSTPPEEQMFSEEYVAECNDEVKKVENEDRDLIDAKKETFFTYQFPIERIQEQVNEKLGRTPPEDTCDLSDNNDNNNNNIGEVEILTPQTGTEYLVGDDIQIELIKPDTLNIERIDIALNNVIIQTFDQNQSNYQFNITVDEGQFSIGNNTIKVVTVDTDGNTQSKEINVTVQQPEPTIEPEPSIEEPIEPPDETEEPPVEPSTPEAPPETP